MQLRGPHVVSRRRRTLRRRGRLGDGRGDRHRAVDIGRRDSGLFTFFDPGNLELLVKVLEGCSLTDHYWVFYGATTDQGFELTVTDTQTGAESVYANPPRVSAEPVKDFFAFPCEP